MGGKFNPARATRADFNELFEVVQEGIPALERQMSAIRAEMTAKYSLLYEEVQTACGEYRNLGERLDAGDDALEAEESARTAADTSEAAARAAADTKHDSVLADLIDGSTKNMLQMTHAAGSITRYGVTCTWDPDEGTMTLNGTHASSASAAAFEFYAGNAVDTKVFPAGEYHLSGCPAGGSTTSYRAAVTQVTGAVDLGSGADFTLSEPHYIAYRILVSGDCSFDNMVFRPMICSKDAWEISQKFVPYCPPPSEMYAMIKVLQAGSGTQAQLTSLRPVAGLTTDAAEPEDTEVLDDA